MANTKDCPKCNELGVKVTKKGKNAAGDQRWKCSACGASFIEAGSAPVAKKKPAKVAAKKPAKKPTTAKRSISTVKKPSAGKKKSSVSTIIKVNSNEVKRVDGEKSIDEAHVLVSNYFREVNKLNASTTKDSDGNVIYSFTIKTGKKG